MSQLPTTDRPSVGRSTSRPAVRFRTPHVLVVCADHETTRGREQHLRSHGAVVLTACTGFEAVVKASCHMPDLIVLDESLGETEVVETARLLMGCPVTARTPLLCLQARQRVPARLLAAIRRQHVL